MFEAGSQQSGKKGWPKGSASGGFRVWGFRVKGFRDLGFQG